MVNRTVSIENYIKSAQSRGVKANGDQQYDCPYCHGRGKFEVSRSRGLWYCHKCTHGGKLSSKPGTYFGQGKRAARSFDLSEYHPTLKNSLHYRYLREQREIPEDLIAQMEPHRGPYPLVIYFPAYGLGSSRPVFFQGRSLIDGTEPKYFNTGGCSKSEVLWGLHRIQRSPKRLVLCEGIFDAVWGSNRVALFGKTISLPQLKIIERVSPQEVTVFLDGSARKESMAVGEAVARHWSGRVSVWWILGNKDPDDLRGKGLVDIRQERIA